MSKGLIVDVFAEAGLLWSVHQSNYLELGQYISDCLGLHLVHLGEDAEEHADMQKHVTAVPLQCPAVLVATRELCPFQGKNATQRRRQSPWNARPQLSSLPEMISFRARGGWHVVLKSSAVVGDDAVRLSPDILRVGPDRGEARRVSGVTN